ncbi:MAG: VOC family protein [Granulosicoccus sp.]
MKQSLAQTAILVKDYDEAIDFYVHTLGFALVEDRPVTDPLTLEADKRWVIVCPSGSTESRLLLARAVGTEQLARIGDQAGGRVFLFLYTDDFWRDYTNYQAKGVQFPRGEPRRESYGTVAVFQDLYGNLWDLIQPAG